MILSKSHGEKLDDKYMNVIYGKIGCGGKCGNCDCTGGGIFYDAFDPEMKNFEIVYDNSPE